MSCTPVSSLALGETRPCSSTTRNLALGAGIIGAAASLALFSMGKLSKVQALGGAAISTACAVTAYLWEAADYSKPETLKVFDFALVKDNQEWTLKELTELIEKCEVVETIDLRALNPIVEDLTDSSQEAVMALVKACLERKELKTFYPGLDIAWNYCFRGDVRDQAIPAILAKKEPTGDAARFLKVTRTLIVEEEVDKAKLELLQAACPQVEHWTVHAETGKGQEVFDLLSGDPVVKSFTLVEYDNIVSQLRTDISNALASGIDAKQKAFLSKQVQLDLHEWPESVDLAKLKGHCPNVVALRFSLGGWRDGKPFTPDANWAEAALDWGQSVDLLNIGAANKYVETLEESSPLLPKLAPYVRVLNLAGFSDKKIENLLPHCKRLRGIYDLAMDKHAAHFDALKQLPKVRELGIDVAAGGALPDLSFLKGRKKSWVELSGDGLTDVELKKLAGLDLPHLRLPIDYKFTEEVVKTLVEEVKPLRISFAGDASAYCQLRVKEIQEAFEKGYKPLRDMDEQPADWDRVMGQGMSTGSLYRKAE